MNAVSSFVYNFVKKKKLKEKVSAAFIQRSNKYTDFAVAPYSKGQKSHSAFFFFFKAS